MFEILVIVVVKAEFSFFQEEQKAYTKTHYIFLQINQN